MPAPSLLFARPIEQPAFRVVQDHPEPVY